MRCFYALEHKEEKEKRRKPERKIQKPFDGGDPKKQSIIDLITDSSTISIFSH